MSPLPKQKAATPGLGVTADCELGGSSCAYLLDSTAHADSGRAGIVVEHFQASTHAFAGHIGGQNVDLGAHLGSQLRGRIIFGERICGPLEINRNDLAEWKEELPLWLAKHSATGVHKAPSDNYTIWYSDVNQVEACSLIHCHTNWSEANTCTWKEVGLRNNWTKAQ